MIKKPLKFFGAYVTNVSCSLGWGGETSTCSLTLVEDVKNGVTFKPPTLGTPCLFKINPNNKKDGYFKFGGVFQSYTEKKSVGGGTQYDVILESPARILDGVVLVLDKFQGTVYKEDFYLPNEKPVLVYGQNGPTNLFNIFAKKENSVTGGQFGASNSDESGYPVNNIIYDIYETVTQPVSIPPGIPAYYGGKIYYGDSTYVIDLDALIEPVGRILGYRIESDFISLNALINEICEQAGYDYIITIDSDKVDANGIIIGDAKIKVKTLERTSQPAPGAIKKLVQDYTTKSDAENILISYELGKEYSNDIATQKVMVGGPVSRYWMSNFDYNNFLPFDQNHILPIFGTAQVATDLGPQTIYYFSDYNSFNNAYAYVNVVSDGGSTNNFSIFRASMLEIRCAATDRKTWNAYHGLLAMKKRKYPKLDLETFTFGNYLDFNAEQFDELLQGKALPNDLQNTSMDSAEDLALVMLGADPLKVIAQRQIEARWNAISAVAGNFYGNHFFVKIPGEMGGLSNTLKYVDNGLKLESAWYTTDSAWSSAAFRSMFSDIKSYDENGRFKAIAIYDNFENAEYTEFGKDYVMTPFGVASHDVQIDGNKIIWQEVSTTDSMTGQPSVMTAGFVPVVTPKVPLYDSLYTEVNGFNVLAQLIFGESIPVGIQNSFGSENLEIALGPHMLLPKMIGIPQETKRYVWGPWFSFNNNYGVKGKVELLEKPEFAPENFGSIEMMNFYGQSYVNADMVSLYENESGYVELAEIPTGSLGDSFMSAGPYITDMSISIGVEGLKTTYKFRTWTKNFGKMAKYNIERISKLQRQSFSFFKNIRDMFQAPVPKAVNRKLLGLIQKAKVDKFQNEPAVNMQMGSFYKGVVNVINSPSDPGSSTSTRGSSIASSNGTVANSSSTPSTTASASGVSKVNVQSSSMQGGLKSLGVGYEYAFGCSSEQIYTPIVCYNQTKAQSGILLPSSIRSVHTGVMPTGTINPTGDFPCFAIAPVQDTGVVSGVFYNKNVTPTSYDLDPYFKFEKTDFQCVVKDTRDATKDINITKDPIKSFVKTMGLRGPLLFSGWGYDVAGLPVPNNATGVATNGFPSGEWSFHKNTSVDRALWKTGPIDLRWHDQRKVWVGGHEILEGFLMEDVSQGGQAQMKVYRRSASGPNIANNSEEATKNEYITVNILDSNVSASSGAYIMVVDINYEWRPIWISC